VRSIRAVVVGCALAVAVATPFVAQADGTKAHHVVLWYIDESPVGAISTNGRPLVAFVDPAVSPATGSSMAS
jgi:hypothetical protein